MPKGAKFREKTSLTFQLCIIWVYCSQTRYKVLKATWLFLTLATQFFLHKMSQAGKHSIVSPWTMICEEQTFLIMPDNFCGQKAGISVVKKADMLSFNYQCCGWQIVCRTPDLDGENVTCNLIITSLCILWVLTQEIKKKKWVPHILCRISQNL